MVNWKKFFVETDDESTNANNTKNSKDTRSKLQRWFEEDFNENNQRNKNDDDFEIEFFDKEESFDEKKKSKSNNIDHNLAEKFEDSDIDVYEEDIEIDFEEEKTPKQNGFFSRFISLFKDKNQNMDDYSNEDLLADDEPEDYKTYLERQKAEKNNSKKDLKEDKQDHFDFDIEFTEEDDNIFEDDLENNNKQSFFTKFKNKFMKNDSEFEENDDFEEGLFDEKEFNEKLESEADKKKGFFSKLLKDSEDKKFEESLEEIDNKDIDIKEYTEENLENYEEIEEDTFEEDQEEQLNEKLQNTLKSLGIESSEIREVDIFSENHERRTHPTLAAVRVKRIIQDQKIEDLGKDVILEEDKKSLLDDLTNKEITLNSENYEENEIRTSKHSEERKQLIDDFNNIARKEEKITTRNSLKYSSNPVDKAIDNIKEKELAVLEDNKEYSIQISENDKSKERRDKLKFTTVEEILEGNDDLFENDVDTASKKLVISCNENKEIISEDIEQFRKDALKEKTSKDLIYDKNNITELDHLIVDTKLVEKAQEEELQEITKLEENLQLIKKENSEKKLKGEHSEEISIEKIAKDNEIHYPEYDELKEIESSKNILDGYSDYHLDNEEIEELTVKNEIESKSEKADIESLTKEVSNTKKVFNNDIDKFKEEKTFTPEKKETGFVEFQDNKEITEKFEDAKTEGIEYTEKLYTNDVDEFFVDDSSPLTFGEYKTKDRGYRPVSKETIENNQKKLDAIFEKYSNISVPRKNTTSYVEQKLATEKPRTVGKFKPSPVYSSIYGSIDNSKKELPNNEQSLKPQNTKDSSFKKKEKNNYFKEIAKQDETVWNINLGSRANKKNKKG